MKRIGTYVVIALIALAIGAFATSKWFTPEPEVVVETKHDTIIKTEIDSTKIQYLQDLLDKEKAKVKTVTIKVPVPVETGEEPDSVVVVTKQYNGTEELDNGTIDYEIYADSLYAVKFSLETKDTIINTTTTITKTLPPKSALFVGGGFDYNQGLSNAEVGLMYNRRQKWQVGVVVNHDLTGLLPQNARTSVGLRAYFKL